MSQLVAKKGSTSPAIITLVLALALVSILAISLVITGGSYVEPSAGLPDSGPLVVWGTPILRLITDVAAIATIGWLLAASVLDPAGKGGVVSAVGRRDLMRAGIAACVWAVLAVVQMLFTLANILGLTLREALNPAVITTYANEIPATRALMAVTLLAIVIGLGLSLIHI